jgi:flagellar biosynthesis protein FlhF
MKIKRFFAADIRTAIKQVRDALGADAVILSNKSVDGGVELVAALDFDESAFVAKAEPIQRERYHSDANVEPLPLKQGGADGSTTAQSSGVREASQRIEWSQDPLLVDMRHEMHTLRRMVENELSGLSWRDMGERQPQVRDLLRRMMDLDLSPAICKRLVEQVGEFSDIDEGWRKSLYFLASEIEVSGDKTIEEGGVVAVVGPTGVGKTTSIAKLAARFALRHGNRHVAFISADSYRIGAQDQLTTYARILDIPMRSASNVEELNIALNALSDKRLILIDTTGMSQRDVRLSEQLSLLQSGSRPVQTLLTLAATTQQAALRQAIKAFGAATPSACILTKLDEAGALGGVLSSIIDSGLPVAYITDGQRVPEDLHLARAHTLVSRAVNLGNHGGSVNYGEECMALALGGAKAHAHA